jgi:hypothetical protein
VQEYMRVIVLTKSRRRASKSSGSFKDLAVERSRMMVTLVGKQRKCSGYASLGGLMVWASKSPVDGFRVWALKPRCGSGSNWKQHVASSRDLHRGRAKS